ncbi:MAG: family transcriptional regulator, cyclic receptor protein [Chloroflexota bacterium]|jgi:CRP-like cAMP-binding protein|nr:family transcriptional regulator, cyclic receptor protein [Chloroflexota bacterium]
MATTPGHLIDTLSGISLFADVAAAELNSIAHAVEERRFADGERIIRQGLTGSAFYLILEGEAAIRVDGKDLGTLSRGEFFGEISILLGEPPVADIIATRSLRCAIIAGPELEAFMLTHPTVMYRMLKAEARKLQRATSWRT